MKNLINYHILTVTYLGATNNTGSRVKIKSDRFGTSKIISYDHQFNNTADIAVDYLTKNGFEIIGQGEAKDGYFLISNTFRSPNEKLKKASH